MFLIRIQCERDIEAIEIKRFQWPIKDPFTASGTDEEIMNEFRRTRDEIKEKIGGFISDFDNQQF